MENKVYSAINAVQADLAKLGIGKDNRNEQQGYKFRGIDDIYNALASLLAKHHLCILPRALNRSVTEKASRNGGSLFYSVVDVEFDVVSSEDGSKHTIKTFGEAMDSGDKSTNKAMSAAYKYACLQMFCIPTEGDNDADKTTHEVIANPQVLPSHGIQSKHSAEIDGLKAAAAAAKAKYKAPEPEGTTWIDKAEDKPLAAAPIGQKLISGIVKKYFPLNGKKPHVVSIDGEYYSTYHEGIGKQMKDLEGQLVHVTFRDEPYEYKGEARINHVVDEIKKP